MVVKKDRVVLICQTFVSRPFYFFFRVAPSSSLALARTRTTRSFSPFLSFSTRVVLSHFQETTCVKRDAWEGKQIIQRLNGYLRKFSSLLQGWTYVRSYYNLRGKTGVERRRGYSYNFIYTHEVGDIKVNDTEHDSNTPIDLCRLRDPLLTYIKICANTFDNHKYICIYTFILLCTFYGAERLLRESRGNWRIFSRKYSSSPARGCDQKDKSLRVFRPLVRKFRV